MKEYIKPELKYVVYNNGIMQDDDPLGDLVSIGEDEEGGDLGNSTVFDEEEAIPTAKSVWD